MDHSPSRKNVIDRFQQYEDAFIKDFLAPRRLPMKVICEHIVGDFNVSNVVRTAEGFNLDSVVITNRRKWDRRGAVGAHNRISVRYRPDVVSAVADLPDSYTVVALDNVPGAIPMHEFHWTPDTALLVGEEQRGLSDEALAVADFSVYIPMMGAVRSFNVAGAAGMAMYDYANKTTGFAGDRDRKVLMEFDEVSRPKHYNSHPSGIEVIRVTEQLSFCLGNFVKYVLRSPLKNNTKQDLEKALWYLKREEEKMQSTAYIVPESAIDLLITMACEDDNVYLDDVLYIIMLLALAKNVEIAVVTLERYVNNID